MGHSHSAHSPKPSPYARRRSVATHTRQVEQTVLCDGCLKLVVRVQPRYMQRKLSSRVVTFKLCSMCQILGVPGYTMLNRAQRRTGLGQIPYPYLKGGHGWA